MKESATLKTPSLLMFLSFSATP